MKKLFKTITMGLVLCAMLVTSLFNVEAKAANYSSDLENQEITLFWPTDSFTITSPYGWRKLYGEDDFHPALDIKAKVGTGVYAAADGYVKYARYNSSAGYYVMIVHPDGRKTKYCHLSKILVKEKQYVTVGTKIGKSGKSGRVTGPHLDFQVYDFDGSRIDPETVTVKKRASEVKVPTGYVYITTPCGNVLEFDPNINMLKVAKKDPNNLNQIFEIISYDKYKYMIRCYNLRDGDTNMMIDVAWGGCSDGDQIWAWEQNFTEAQTWTIVYYPEAGGFNIISSESKYAGKDMVLDIANQNDSPNEIIHLWTRYDGLWNQIFNFEKAF